VNPAERQEQARLAMVEVGVIAQMAIELVAIHPERSEQIMATAQSAIARRKAD